MYESLIIAPPMFCCGYHKQPILVVLNRNTNRSEVFREPMALTANLGGHLAMADDDRRRSVPSLSIGEGHWPASGPCGHSGMPRPEWARRARSPLRARLPLHKNQTPPGAT